MQCANVKPNRGYAFNTVCFINTGIASSDVNVFCWSAGMNPGVSCDRVSGNGAQLRKWELDLWPVVVESYLAGGRAGEQQGGCRLQEPQPTLQLELPSGPLHALHTSLFLPVPASYSYYHNLNSLYRRSLSLFSFFCLVRSPASHAKKRFPWIFPAKLEQVTNNLLFTSLLFTVMVCLLSLETDRNCKFRRWWISVPVWGYTAVDSTSVGIYL